MVVIATPEPEIEAWVVTGFEPRDAAERKRLEEVRAELSFDPTREAHRLTAHPNDAPRDAKRVLQALCLSNEDREDACLADHSRLRARGASTYLPEFLDELTIRLVPSLARRGA